MPLSPATLHVLLALTGGELHGYGIMLEVARQSGGQYKIGPGTLYDNLKKLLRLGLVEEAPEPDDSADATPNPPQISTDEDGPLRSGRRNRAADGRAPRSAPRPATARGEARMSKLQRRIYSALLRLHPAAFRRQFGRDMARDCEDAIRDRGFAVLIGDAFLSLARQWKSRALAGPETETEPAVAGHPFLSGQYIVVTHGSSLTAFDLVSASALSILLLLTIGYAASMPNRLAIADQQTATASHDGGIDTGSNGAPLTAHDAHRERPGEPDFVAAGGTPHYKGIVRLGHAAAPSAWGERASGGRRASEPLASALRQFALISIIVWLTSLLLRRTPGAGRRMVLGGLGLLCVAASVAFGQPTAAPAHSQILYATSPLPSFEVATVRPEPRPAPPPPPPPGATDNRPPSPRMVGIGKLGGQQTDRVHVTASPALLILFAYNLPFGSERTGLSAAPTAGSAEYEVQAKIDDSLYAAMQKMSPEQQREQVDLMEQSLLADRFKLKVHFETREMPVYALVVAKGGPKLTLATDGERSNISSFHSEIAAKAVTLDDFATSSLWTPIGGRLVVDQTGLKGAYDFTLNWSQEQTAAEPGQDGAPALSPIFAVIEEQLGLKLVPTKTPIEVIVIDHIEKPTEN